MLEVLRQPVLCLVTDRRRLAGRRSDDIGPLIRLIQSAVDAEIELVQIREEGLPDRRLHELVSEAVAAAADTPTRVVVNDRVDIALSGGAAGVHLKACSVPTERVRRHVPGGWLVGRSIHSVAEARSTDAGGLDYVILGTVFPSPSKPGGALLGVEPLTEAARALPIPLLAIGGVTLETVPAVARSGAAGFAGIGLFAALATLTPQEFRGSVDKIRQRWRITQDEARISERR